MFVKGANLAPTRMALGDATPTEMRRYVELAREAGSESRCECTATSRGRSCTTLPTNWACCCGRISRCSGATTARSAKRPFASPRSSRPARPPPLDRCVVRAQRTRRAEPRSNVTEGARPRLSTSPANSPRRGTIPSSIAGSTGPSSRPTKRGPPSPTAASCRTSRCSTAPTATSTSVGITVTRATYPASPCLMPRMVRFVSEFGAQAVPAAADFMEPDPMARSRLGAAAGTSRAAAPRLRAVRPACRLSRRSTDGAMRRSGIRPSCCVTTSRRCDASSTSRPAASASSCSTMARRWCHGACSITNGTRSWPTRRSSTPAGPSLSWPIACPTRCRSAPRWPSMCTWSATSAACSKTPCARPSSVGRVVTRPGVGRRRATGFLCARSHHPIRRCRSARRAVVGPRRRTRRRGQQPIATSAPSSADRLPHSRVTIAFEGWRPA